VWGPRNGKSKAITVIQNGKCLGRDILRRE
jgi:hypothetical protein